MRIFSSLILSGLMASSLVFSGAARSADAEGNYAVWGEGGLSCFQYNQMRTKEDDAMMKAFLRGYLTAYNTLSGDTYSITGPHKMPEIMEILDSHCEEKAMDSFDRAIQFMITKIEDERYRTPKQKGLTGGWGQQ